MAAVPASSILKKNFGSRDLPASRCSVRDSVDDPQLPRLSPFHSVAGFRPAGTRRLSAAPIRPKPRSIIPQLAGSGTAAAGVLFGDVNPGGKLAITFPHSVGDLPDFYNHKPSANRSYEFSTREQASERYISLGDTSYELDKARITLLRATGELENWVGLSR